MQTSMLLYKVWRMWFFILFIFSMYPWFSWNVNPVAVSVITFFISFVLYTNGGFVERSYFPPLIVLLVFFIWQARRLNLFGLMNSVCFFISIATLFCLKEELKIDLIRFVTKWFAIIVGISMLFYILYLIGVPLPYTSSQMGDSSNYIFDNYYFFLTKDFAVRFRGPFLEPGHMTMGLAPLLFINRYDFKNPYVLILTLAQFLSISLAGIIVFFVGFFLITYSSAPTIKKAILSTLTIIVIVFFASILVYYFFGREAIEEEFLARLVFDSDLGTIAGYNRSTDYFDSIYNKVMASSDKWYGVEVNEDAFEGGVAGYKRFIVENGLIATFLIIVVYVLLLFQYKGRRSKQGSLFLIVVLLLLFQNAYPLWWCMLISAACSLPFMHSTNINSSR